MVVRVECRFHLISAHTMYANQDMPIEFTA